MGDNTAEQNMQQSLTRFEREESSNTQNLKSALMVAHPGHEVRIHGWLERARPTIFILTDGSGRAGQPRLRETSDYFSANGWERGSIFGSFTDMSIYKLVLERKRQPFIEIACELADFLLREDVDQIAGDALEGYNSTHDVCRIIIGAAVEMANRIGKRRIINYDFTIVGRPDLCPGDLCKQSLFIRLDNDTFARKINAAKTYYPELFAEIAKTFDRVESGSYRSYLDYAAKVDDKVKTLTLDAFRVECLRPADNRIGGDEFINQKPFYEMHGERQVEAGHYSQVICFSKHIRPLFDSLWNYVEKQT
jgi:hypothetical protein